MKFLSKSFISFPFFEYLLIVIFGFPYKLYAPLSLSLTLISLSISLLSIAQLDIIELKKYAFFPTCTSNKISGE